MCGCCAPTFGTAKPRLPEGWALTAHAPRAAFPTQSRSTHGVPIRENLGQCNELLLQRGLRDGGSPAGQRGRGQGLGVLRLRKQMLAYEEWPLREWQSDGCSCCRCERLGEHVLIRWPKTRARSPPSCQKSHTDAHSHSHKPFTHQGGSRHGGGSKGRHAHGELEAHGGCGERYGSRVRENDGRRDSRARPYRVESWVVGARACLPSARKARSKVGESAPVVSVTSRVNG